MSLSVKNDRGGRSRSRSRDGRSRDEPKLEREKDRDRDRDRERDRDKGRDRDRQSYPDVRGLAYKYPEDDPDDLFRSSRRPNPTLSSSGGLPYPSKGGIDSMVPGSQSTYDYKDDRPIYRTASPPRDPPHRGSRSKPDDILPGSFPDDDAKNLSDDDSDNDSDDDKHRQARYKDPRDPRHSVREDNHNNDKNKYPQSRQMDPRDTTRYSGTRDDDDNDRRRQVRYQDPRDSRISNRDDDDEDRQGYGGRLRKKGDRSPIDDDDKFKFLPQKYSRNYDDNDRSRGSDRDKDKKEDRRRKKERDEEDLAYGKTPLRLTSGRESPPKTYGTYLPGSQPRDSKTISKPSMRGDSPDRSYSGDVRHANPGDGYDHRRESNRGSYGQDPRSSAANVLTVGPRGQEDDKPRDRRRDKSPGPAMLGVDTGRNQRESSRDRRGSGRDKSPQPPTNRLSGLTVNTGRSSNLSLSAAPPSPLLESYHGTYQDCSPMPSPLLLTSGNPMDDPRILDGLSPLSSDAEGDSKRRGRRARFYDPEDTASRIAKALKGEKPPDTQPLIDILPSLTHEQVMELRVEYKQLVKTGPDRKGVNVAKHIRARLKDEDSKLMKACYAVALGKWESESYWANFWYQGDKTRRELLIESLMGRTNEEIREIKDAFTDKKYDNSLAKCMKTELKEDKFKKAVLLVLDERRMEETDHIGRKLPIDTKLAEEDASNLRKSVKAEKGGESTMISIIIQRSDSHLRAILQAYEHHYGGNFAREALKKSGNLVVS